MRVSNLHRKDPGRRTDLISVVFYQKAPLPSTAPGTSTTTSRTSHPTSKEPAVWPDKQISTDLTSQEAPVTAIPIAKDLKIDSLKKQPQQQEEWPTVCAVRPMGPEVVKAIICNLHPVPSFPKPHHSKISQGSTTDRRGNKVSPLETSSVSGIIICRSVRKPVPKKEGTFRPVINLKPLNSFIRKQHFKMEGTRMWSGQLYMWNGRDVHLQIPDNIMVVDNIMPPCWQERTLHINQLELLARLFSVRAFAKDRRDINIHLRMGNNTSRFCQSDRGTRSPSLMR